MVLLVQEVFTKEELHRVGHANSSTLMIGIMGEIFDVSKSPKYYGAHMLSLLSGVMCCQLTLSRLCSDAHIWQHGRIIRQTRRRHAVCHIHLAAAPAEIASAQRAGGNGSYSFFAGVDASRAYLTGNFTGDLNDNITDFDDDQLAGLSRWRDFYHKVPPSCTMS
jgi:hypothetical protein